MQHRSPYTSQCLKNTTSANSTRRAVPTGLNAATIIGDYVTVEPYCVLRSCRIEPKVLIGARSVVCEGAIVETESILTPGSVVPPARRIPSGELWGGSPAKFIRKLTGNEVSKHLRARTHTHTHTHAGPYDYTHVIVRDVPDSFPSALTLGTGSKDSICLPRFLVTFDACMHLHTLGLDCAQSQTGVLMFYPCLHNVNGGLWHTYTRVVQTLAYSHA